MGTTTKMAIPYPEATGLVKDGWEDMKDIATQVDAKSGLVLLNTTSFSGVTSFTRDSIFSSNYDNYRILLKYTQTASNTTTIRFRTSGVSNTSGLYSNAVYRYQSDNTVGGQAGDEGQTYLTINGAAIANFINNYSIDVFSPNLAEYTHINMTGYLGQSSTRIRGIFGSGHFASTTVFDGFEVIATTGNLSGTYSIFGYNK